MELIEIIKYALYVVTGVISWFIKLLWNNNKKMNEEIEALKLNLVGNYVRKDDLKELVSEIRGDFKEVMEKVNRIDDFLRRKD